MNKLKQVIDAWDPVDLLSHSPNDEYHSEIEEIEQLLKSAYSSEELADGIFKVFMESFGEEVFTKSKSECKQIAQMIFSR